MNEPERDFDADMALCESATCGPWQHDHFGGSSLAISHVALWLIIASARAAGNGEGMVPLRFNDAEFIAAARDGWPAALRRIKELEAEVARLNASPEEAPT